MSRRSAATCADVTDPPPGRVHTGQPAKKVCHPPSLQAARRAARRPELRDGRLVAALLRGRAAIQGRRALRDRRLRARRHEPHVRASSSSPRCPARPRARRAETGRSTGLGATRADAAPPPDPPTRRRHRRRRHDARTHDRSPAAACAQVHPLRVRDADLAVAPRRARLQVRARVGAALARAAPLLAARAARRARRGMGEGRDSTISRERASERSDRHLQNSWRRRRGTSLPYNVRPAAS